MTDAVSLASANPPVLLRFLGGLEEIGMNCSSITCADTHLLIDAGIGFPDPAYFPGASLMHAPFERLHDPPPTALLLTHGHEDHIGAVAYLLQIFDIPVFGTPFTLGLVKAKTQEHNLRPDLRVIQPGKPVEIGPFLVEWLQVNHSIPGSCALSILTPQGHLVHSGDLKFDLQASDHQGGASLSRFGSLGDIGVDLLLCESTQIYSKTPTESEQSLFPSLSKIIQEAPGRVFFVVFASHVERMKMAIEIAQKSGRYLVTSGSSIERNLLIARDLGYLRLRGDEIVDPASSSKLPPQRLLILATGSQAEPGAAMSRIARGEHPFFQLRPDDTVIWSASFIPSNIAAISHQINRIMLQGVRIFHAPLHHVHVSGHASRFELQLLHKLLRPRYLVPIHGEYRFLEEHRRLALSSGMTDDQIFVCQNGDGLLWDEDGLRRTSSLPSERVYRFHPKAPTLSLDVLKDRRGLAKSGVLSISFVLSSQGQIVGDILLEASGIPHQPRDLLHEWPSLIRSLLRDLPPHLRTHTDHLSLSLKRLFRSHFKAIELFPTILSSVHILP